MFEMPILAVFSLMAIVVQAALTLALSYAIFEFTRKKSPRIPNVLPGKFEAPSIEAGKPFAVTFGMPKISEDAALIWWGDVRADAIMESYRVPSGWFNTKRKWYVKGHNYFAGAQFIPTHGVIDGVKQIRIGEKTLWPVANDPDTIAADGVTSISIDEPDFFGGPDSSGGVIGNISIQYGESSQTANEYLTLRMDSGITASRGLVSIILEQIGVGTSPYLRSWGFLLKRTQVLDDGSPQWYISKADINNDLNPAHFLRECYTNSRWGFGYDTALFNDAIWQGVADALYDESFGVSRLWQHENESLEELVLSILDTIDALIYQDPGTGEFILKLIRDDYVAATLPVYDDSDIISISEFVRPSLGEIPDTYHLNYSGVLENVPVSIPEHDIALHSQQGGNTVPYDKDFPAITKAALAGRVLSRERAGVTSMAPAMTAVCKRTMAELRPGDVFKLAWTPLGIVEMIVRVLPDARYGTLTNNKLQFKLMEDIFAAGSSLYAPSPDPLWTLPYNEPAPSTSLLIEAPFWSLVKRQGLSLVLVLDDEAGYLMMGGKKPTIDSLDFELLIRNNLALSFETKGQQAYTATAALTEALPLNAADAVLALDGVLRDVAAGSFAVIEDELVKVTVAVDSSGAEQTTIARGVLDTVPAAHANGTTIWFLEALAFLDVDELAAGRQPGAKLLTRTGAGRLGTGAAPISNADVFDSRQDRPYPPGNVKINGVSYPGNFGAGQPTITWSHRDRLQQLDSIIEHSEGNIGPEMGVTYTLEIYGVNFDSAGTQTVLLRTETGITGTTYTYTEVDERSDSGLGPSDPLNDAIRFILYSIRTE